MKDIFNGLINFFGAASIIGTLLYGIWLYYTGIVLYFPFEEKMSFTTWWWHGTQFIFAILSWMFILGFISKFVFKRRQG